MPKSKVEIKRVDDSHFYLDGKLVDIVLINYQLCKKTNGANIHKFGMAMSLLAIMAKNLGERTFRFQYNDAYKYLHELGFVREYPKPDLESNTIIDDTKTD